MPAYRGHAGFEEEREQILCHSLPTKTGESYQQTLAAIPTQFRISCLDEIAYLIVRSDEAKERHQNPRSTLLSPFLEPLLQRLGRPWIWMWTHIALRAAARGLRFTERSETDNKGQRYYLADCLFRDEVVAEGVRIPEGNDRKVVEWNRELLLPAITSNHPESQHTVHFRFDPTSREVGVMLYGVHCLDDLQSCLALDATNPREAPLPNAGYRLFRREQVTSSE
jgi:hypothetical protein